MNNSRPRQPNDSPHSPAAMARTAAQVRPPARRTASPAVPETTLSLASFNINTQPGPAPQGVQVDVIGPLLRVLDQEIPQIVAAAVELDPSASSVTFSSVAPLAMLARNCQIARSSFVRQLTSSAAAIGRMAKQRAQDTTPTNGFANVAERVRAVDNAAMQFVEAEIKGMSVVIAEKYDERFTKQAQSIADAIPTDRKSIAAYRIRSARPAVTLIAAIDPAIIPQLPALRDEYISQGWQTIYENATRMIATFGATYVSELPWLQYEAALRREAATIARNQLSTTPGQLAGRAGDQTREIQHATWLSNAFTRAAELRAGDGAARLLDLVLAKTIESFRFLAGEDFSVMSADQIHRSMSRAGGTLDAYLSSTKIEKHFVERFCVRAAPITLTPWSRTGVTTLDRVLTGIASK